MLSVEKSSAFLMTISESFYERNLYGFRFYFCCNQDHHDTRRRPRVGSSTGVAGNKVPVAVWRHVVRNGCKNAAKENIVFF